MRIEMNKGIAYNQCASGSVEVGGFAFTSHESGFSTWHGSILGPIDGIKEDGQLIAEVGGRPEFGFTGRIISVPS